ncbi:MAG: hypothetical protein SH809_13300 [Rhodothermales bacterium]|nr:hypothetical protein [Rhodothermales bacterium]
MVSPRPIYLASILCAGFLFLSACEDPSAVGLDLVDTEGGVPQLQRVAFDRLETTSGDGLVDNATTLQSGFVDDPIVGSIEATGYIDFLENLVLPPAYKNGTLTGLLLRLELATVYGDSSSPVTFALHEVLSEFKSSGNEQDDVPAVGLEIVQFTVDPDDDAILVTLPESFYAGRDTTFRSIFFGTSFHGFQVRPVSGAAVIGLFNSVTSESNLRGIVGADTVTFLATKGLTAYTRPTPATPPPGVTILQQGLGPNLAFDFDLDAFEQSSVNRAAFQVTLDTLVFENDPPAFVRPPLSNMALHGVLADSTSIILALGTLRSNGVTLDFDSASFREALQSVLLGAPAFDHYEIRFLSASGNNLSSLVFRDTTSAETPPSLYLTTTPLNQGN